MSYSVYSNAISDYETVHELTRATSMETARVFGEYFPGLTSAQAFGVEALGAGLMVSMAFWLSHPSHTRDAEPQKRQPLSLWSEPWGKPPSSSSTKSAILSNPLTAPLTMGCTVFGLINLLAPYTQAGMNPARDFGPRLVAYAAGWTNVAFEGFDVYLLAPVVGALLGAAWMDKVVMAEDASTKSTTASTSASAAIPVQTIQQVLSQQ